MCSLSSLYALTNIEYLLFPSSTLEIFSTAKNSFLTILLYASIFPCSCGYLEGIDLSLMLLRFQKMSEYFRCKLFTIIMHYLFRFTILYNVVFKYLQYIYTSLFLSDQSLDVFLEQASSQLIK